MTSRSTALANSQTQWRVYVDDKFGSSVEFPEFWIIDEKQYRFEKRVELSIELPGLSNPDYGNMY